MTRDDVDVNVHHDSKIVITIPERYYLDNYHRQGNTTYVTLRPLRDEEQR